MNHEGLLIGVSVATAISSFSSTAEIGNRSTNTSLHLFGFHETALKSEYKPPFYKIWQYFTKNKPFTHNSSAVCSDNKKQSYIRWICALCKPYPETGKAAEGYITQPIAINQQRVSWFKCVLFFFDPKDHSIGWRYIFSFVLHVCTVKRMLTYVKNVFKNNKTYNHKKQDFGLRNLALQIYSNIVWKRLESLCSIDVSFNKFSFHRMCC